MRGPCVQYSYNVPEMMSRDQPRDTAGTRPFFKTFPTETICESIDDLYLHSAYQRYSKLLRDITCETKNKTRRTIFFQLNLFSIQCDCAIQRTCKDDIHRIAEVYRTAHVI